MGLIFKPQLLPKVLDGTKTETRRPRKPGERLIAIQGLPKSVLTTNSRLKWHVGSVIGALPGRGKHSVGRIVIQDLSVEFVSDITEEAAQREGFANRQEFLDYWDGLYGPGKRDVEVWVIKFKREGNNA